MMSFLIYEGKVAAALLSFILPLCIITIHKQIVVDAEGVLVANGVAVPTVAQPWWHIALFALFWAGVAFVLCRVAVSVISILRIVRGGEQVATEDGCRLIVTQRDIDPFSWMHYIVLSQKDWEAEHATIVAHEKASNGVIMVTLKKE